MIPKIIHYCWFGNGSKSELIENCIASWKKYCPDYEIIEWNESNFDINSNSYVKEAYISKKWAFVSDYVRIWALYQYGGLYLDTDVEIKKNMDCFLSHKAFTGFENDTSPFTAVFGCEKNSDIAKIILDSYKDRHFITENGIDTETNTEAVKRIFVEHYGVRLDNSFQEFEDGLAIYPKEYFCPKSYSDSKVYATKNTYAIHWFDGSWIDISVKEMRKKEQKLNRIFGRKLGGFVLGVSSQMKKEGVLSYLKKRITKYV